MILSRHSLDHLAIALSALCIVHCLAIPLAVALLPLLAVSFGAGGHFHSVMLWLVVPTSVAGLGLGYRVHRRAVIIALGATAIAALGAAALWGHGVWASPVESLVSVAGSLVLAGAHWVNFREVRQRHRHC